VKPRKTVAALPTRTACRTCASKDLARDVELFLVARKAGTTDHSWQEFYRVYVLATYDKAPGETSLRRHANKCLRKDHTTGKDL
jgi:hypothetical protein